MRSANRRQKTALRAGPGRAGLNARTCPSGHVAGRRDGVTLSVWFYCSTMVNCDTWLMNGENVAVRPNRSVAVTVYVMVPIGASAGTFHAPVHISEGCREYSDAGKFPWPRHRIGTSIVLPPTVRWAVRTAVFSV